VDYTGKCFLSQQAASQIKKLYDLFIKVDATQVEINPFGETPDGQGKMKHLTMSYLPCK
jgi:succinyl-CoA synthetase beta subunit